MIRGQIIRNEKGEAQGIFIDMAIDIVKSRAPKPTPEIVAQWSFVNPNIS